MTLKNILDKFNKIGLKTIGPMLILSIFTLTAIYLSVFFYTKNLVISKIEELVLLKSEKLNSSLTERIDSWKTTVTLLSNYPTIKSMDWTNSKKYILSEPTVFHDFLFFYMADLSGNYNTTIGGHSNLSDRRYFQEVLRTNSIVISEPVISKSTKKPIIVVAAPIHNNKNKLVGVLGGVIELSQLTRIINAEKTGVTGYSILLDSTGLTIAHPNQPFIMTKNIKDDKELVSLYNKITNSNKGIHYYSFNKVKKISSYTKMSLTNWRIITSIHYTEAIKDASSLKNILFIIITLSILCMFTIMFLLINIQVVTPIKRLKKSVDIVEEGNLLYNIDIPSNDEIGQLAQSFDKMRNKLKNDILALKEAEQSLIHANTIKRQFLANMSHEIRTPMNGIIGFLHLLGESNLNEEQKNYLNKIEFSSESLLILIDDILDFSKIEAGKLTFSISNFDIHTSIKESAELFSRKALEKNIYIEYSISPSVPNFVNGDSVRVRQILNNLISNAVKFTHKGGVSITANLLYENDWEYMLSFKVTDTGIGISQENISKLFNFFTQIDSSESKKYGGTGLGLTISKNLIEMMNGSINIESTEGIGTTFIFTLKFKK